MKRDTISKLLKIMILGMGIGGFAIFLLVFPTVSKELVSSYPEFSNYYLPWLIFIWLTAIPCYIVLGLMWKFATSVRQGTIFTFINGKRMKKIFFWTVSDTTFFLLGNIFLFLLNRSHPSIFILSMGIIFIGYSIAVISVAFAEFLNGAAALQEENALTI